MSDTTFSDIARAVHQISGLVLSPAQGYLLSSRLGPMLQSRRMAGLDELARRLGTADGPAIAREMAEALTTNETSFFRDDTPFRHIAESTVPALHASRPPGQPLQVWSAACSTGQEAYSVAMAVAEHAPFRGVQILGTDLSPTVVERAREGFYSAFEVQRGLTPGQVSRWLTPASGGWRIAEELRRCCRFQVTNLLGDLSGLGIFDIVLLRNVLIYFDTPTKQRVVDACARRLAKDGVLYLGATETLIGLSTRLAPLPGWRGAWRVA